MKRIYIVAMMVICAGCTYEEIDAICTDPIQLTVLAQTNSLCNQQSGSVTLSSSDGTAPYVFQLGDEENASGSFSELAAGNYVATVTDASRCTGQIAFDIANENGLNIAVEVVDTACGSSEGVILIAATGGVEPYDYQLNGNSQSTNQFVSLAAGNYTVRVSDQEGCSIEQQVRVVGEVAFSAIKNIINTNCAVSGCHNGSRPPNLTNNSTIQSQADRIRSRTANGSMPPQSSGFQLTQAEVEQIGCWVDGGATIN